MLPRQSDDYSAFFHSQNGIETIKSWHLTWNARFGELLFQGFIGGINPYLFDIINAIFGVAFLYIFFILIFGNFPKNLQDNSMIALVLLSFILFSAFGADFVWCAGSLNYMWGLLVIMLFLLPFRFVFVDILNKCADNGGGPLALV